MKYIFDRMATHQHVVVMTAAINKVHHFQCQQRNSLVALSTVPVIYHEQWLQPFQKCKEEGI